MPRVQRYVGGLFAVKLLFCAAGSGARSVVVWLDEQQSDGPSLSRVVCRNISLVCAAGFTAPLQT